MPCIKGHFSSCPFKPTPTGWMRNVFRSLCPSGFVSLPVPDVVQLVTLSQVESRPDILSFPRTRRADGMYLRMPSPIAVLAFLFLKRIRDLKKENRF